MKDLKNITIGNKRVLGWEDGFNECDCCGKTGLKGTYACELEGGDIVHYGSTCVYYNTGLNQKEVKSQIDHEMKFQTNEVYNLINNNIQITLLKSYLTKLDTPEMSWQERLQTLTPIVDEVELLENAIRINFPRANTVTLWYEGLDNTPS